MCLRMSGFALEEMIAQCVCVLMFAGLPACAVCLGGSDYLGVHV